MPKCDFNKVASNFIEITLQHTYSPVNLLHIFRTPFLKNTSGRLLLTVACGLCVHLHWSEILTHDRILINTTE